MTIKHRFHEMRQRAGLAWRVLRDRDGNLVRHTLRETLGMIRGGDGMDREMARGLVDVARVFSAQGHSGFSASWAVSALESLLRFQPLGPLIGDEAEWFVHNCDSETYAQNIRCGHIFRRADGTAYDSEAVIFREPNGCCFTSFHSRRDITFPYTPMRVYAVVPENATEEQKAAAADIAWSVRIS